MDSILAAVAVQPLTMEMRELPRPSIGPEDGLLAIESVGVCGSDWDYYLGHRGNQFPLILGHECVGHMAQVGAIAAQRWQVREGDRVVVEEPFPCGRCRICLSVNYQLCPNGRRYGSVPLTVAPGLWGGFSQALYLHPHSRIYPIAAQIAPELAPLFIPLSNGIRWTQEVAHVQPGDIVVIEGPGQHGLGCVVAAKQARAGHIIVVGLAKDKERLEVARSLGADQTLISGVDPLMETVHSLTSGAMADVVVDVTAGAPEAFSTALDLVRVGGMVILAGAKSRPAQNLGLDVIYRKEITIRGVYGRTASAVVPALELLNTADFPWHRLSTHVFPLGQTDQALRTFGGDIATDRPPIHITIMP